MVGHQRRVARGSDGGREEVTGRRGEKKRAREKQTYRQELVVAGPQLRLMRRVRLAALEDRVPPLDPSLGGGLAEVDLLALVAAGVGV